MLDLDSTVAQRDDVDDARDHCQRCEGGSAQQVWAVRIVPEAGQQAWASGMDHNQRVDLHQWQGGFPLGRYQHSFVSGCSASDMCSHLGGTGAICIMGTHGRSFRKDVV